MADSSNSLYEPEWRFPLLRRHTKKPHWLRYFRAPALLPSF